MLFGWILCNLLFIIVYIAIFAPVVSFIASILFFLVLLYSYINTRLKGYNLDDIIHRYSNKQVESFDEALQNCRNNSSVSGILKDFNKRNGVVEFAALAVVTENKKELLYYKFLPILQLTFLLIFLGGFATTAIRHVLLKRHNQSLPAKLKEFYML